MHEAAKVVMGAPQQSDSVIRTRPGDAAVLKSGLAVSLANTGSPSLTASAGKPLGISRGRTLDGASGVAIEEAGSRSAMQLTAELSNGEDLLFYAKNNDGVSIAVVLEDGATAGAETCVVTTDPDVSGGKLITVGIEAGVSTATQIKAKIDGTAAAALLIGVTISGTGSNDQAEMAYAVLSGSYASPGVAVKRHATNGKASSDGGSTGAVYASGPLTGIFEDKTECLCALVDLQAGF